MAYLYVSGLQASRGSSSRCEWSGFQTPLKLKRQPSSLAMITAPPSKPCWPAQFCIVHTDFIMGQSGPNASLCTYQSRIASTHLHRPTRGLLYACRRLDCDSISPTVAFLIPTSDSGPPSFKRRLVDVT